MRIRVDINRLSNLSRSLRTLEYDISDIANQVARLSKITAQSAKYRNTEYRVRRACDRVLDSVDEVYRCSRTACNRIEGQSRVLSNAVSSYQENDRIEQVNRGVNYYMGSNLRRIFNCSGYYSYYTVIRRDLFKFL